ncbi:unnamed protein product [Brassica oleracea]
MRLIWLKLLSTTNDVFLYLSCLYYNFLSLLSPPTSLFLSLYILILKETMATFWQKPLDKLKKVVDESIYYGALQMYKSISARSLVRFHILLNSVKKDEDA